MNGAILSCILSWAQQCENNDSLESIVLPEAYVTFRLLVATAPNPDTKWYPQPVMGPLVYERIICGRILVGVRLGGFTRI